MKEVNRRLKWQRSSNEVDETGFTLIELLIVIVVLGILAAIVVFALSGVTGQSTTAACQSDAKTVGVAVAALQAENPTAWQALTTGTAANDVTAGTWSHALITNTTAFTGSPFLQSWPTGNAKFYGISVTAGGNTTTGDTVTTTAGDVIVTAKTGGKTYDATINPVSACQHLG